jgi:hypothetical protein
VRIGKKDRSASNNSPFEAYFLQQDLDDAHQRPVEQRPQEVSDTVIQNISIYPVLRVRRNGLQEQRRTYPQKRLGTCRPGGIGQEVPCKSSLGYLPENGVFNSFATAIEQRFEPSAQGSVIFNREAVQWLARAQVTEKIGHDALVPQEGRIHAELKWAYMSGCCWSS